MRKEILNKFFGPVEIEDGHPIRINYVVDNNDIENSVVDEYGVRYSIDGTRLIGFEEKLPRRYAVKEECQMICCNEDLEFLLSIKGCFDDLEELILPEGLEVIGDEVFQGLKKVKTLTIPSTVRYIGPHAFNGVSISFDLDSYTSEEGDMVLVDNGNCSDSILEEVVVKSCNIFIDYAAFYGNKKLKKVLFASPANEDDEVRICHNTFGECTSLKQLSLPINCTIIYNPFIQCTIENIEIDPRQGYLFADGFLTSNGEDGECELIGYYGKEKHVKVPEEVTEICTYAFDNNSTMETIVLPAKLKYIGRSAFCECSGLKSIAIPSEVSMIGEFGFGLCENLSQVIIEGPIKTLELGIFCSCKSLESVVLPRSLRYIEDSAFSDCCSLKTIMLPPYLERIDGNPFAGSGLETIESQSSNFKVIEGGFLVDCCTDTLLAYIGNADNVVIPKGIMQIGASAFLNRSLRHISLPSSLCAIGECAFMRCNNLEEVIIPEGVRTINVSTFAECNSLKKVVLNEGLKVIDNYAFNGCASLENLVIPQSVEFIGLCAFSSLKEVTFIAVPKVMKINPLISIKVPKGKINAFKEIIGGIGANQFIEYSNA